MDSKQFLHNLWLWKCGLPEKQASKPVSLDELRETEWSPVFEKLMRNRLIMGALRYGRLHAPEKPQYDRVNSMLKRLNAYIESGNKEHLVDVANICLLEFEECHHPKAHFESIDDGEHTKTL